MTREFESHPLEIGIVCIKSTASRNLELQRQLDEANRLAAQLKKALRLALDGRSTLDEPTEREPKDQ